MRRILVTTVLFLIFVVVPLFAYFIWYAPHGIDADAEDGGVDPSHDPLQDPIDRDAAAKVEWHLNWAGGEGMLTGVAFYHLDAVLCGVKKYHDEWQAAVAPYDLCVMWGDLAMQDVGGHVRFELADRDRRYWISKDSPYDEDYVITHSAVVHFIPATDNLKRAVGRLDKGDAIELVGHLVDLSGRDHGDSVWWNSSRVRDDRGMLGGELLYTQRLRIGNTIYR